jgi:hypothetical protein
VGLKAHAFTETPKAECVAPTVLRIRRACLPALPDGASFCRAYGAPVDESLFSHGLLRTTLSPGPISLAPLAVAWEPCWVFNCQRAVRPSPGEPDEIFSSFIHWQICGGAPTVPSVSIGAENAACTFSILCDERKAGNYSARVRGMSCFRNCAAMIKKTPPMSVAMAAVDME